MGAVGNRTSINRRTAQLTTSTGEGFVDVKSVFDGFEREVGGHPNEHLVIDDCLRAAMGYRLIAKAPHGVLQPRK